MMPAKSVNTYALVNFSPRPRVGVSVALPRAFAVLSQAVRSGAGHNVINESLDRFVMARSTRTLTTVETTEIGRRFALGVPAFVGMHGRQRMNAVIPACVAAMYPETLEENSTILMSGGQTHLKGAVERGLARAANRPIVGGVEDPNEEDIAGQLEYENGRGVFGRLSDLYFKPKGFERSGRLYEAMGVRYFKKALMALIFKPVAFAGNAILRTAEKGEGAAADGKPNRIEDVATFYSIGRRRDLGRGERRWSSTKNEGRNLALLRKFDAATRKNEMSHAAAAIMGLPIVSMMIAGGLFSPASLLVYLLYALNVYATATQRYNRARVQNTIDLKLKRGPFAPE